MTLTPDVKAQIFTVRNDLLKRINEALHSRNFLDAVLLLEEAVVMSNKIGENERAKEYNQKMSECVEKIFSIDDQADLDPGITADLKNEVERLTRSAQELVQKRQFQDAINDYRNAIEISIKLKDKMAIWKLTKSITLLGDNLSPSELLSTYFTEKPSIKEPEAKQAEISLATKPAIKQPETKQPEIPFTAKAEPKRPEILFPTKPATDAPQPEKPAIKQPETKQPEIPFAVKPEAKRPEILFPTKPATAAPPPEKPAIKQPETKQPEIPFTAKAEPKRPEILFPAKAAAPPPPAGKPAAAPPETKPAEVMITTKPSTPTAPGKEMPFFKAVIPQKASQEPEGKKESTASSKDSEKKLRKEAEKREIERRETEKKEAERKQAEKKQGKKEAEKKQSKAEVKPDTPKSGISSDVLAEIKGFKHDELNSMPPPSTPGAQKKPTASKPGLPSDLLDEIKKKAKK
jgi:hypothetical protein